MDIKDIKISRGNPLIMGATVLGDKVNFAITAGIDSTCSVKLYDKRTGDEITTLDFDKSQVIGNVYAMVAENLDYDKYSYNFVIDGEELTDPYAKALTGREEWGVAPKTERALIIDDSFEWEDDGPLGTPFSDTIIYRLHVRGFTKHPSSKCAHKGTYRGIIDKIPYLKKLGITMIELMPAYDFSEIKDTNPTSMKGSFKIGDDKLNYWGYTDGYAFAPKASFADSKEPGGEIFEFKEMVKKLHQNGIEISMEFYFPYKTNPKLIVDCMHYWVMNYHIDGIHLNCEPAVMRMIETDNILCRTKIFTYCTPDSGDYYSSKYNIRNIAAFSDDFMVDLRRFLKGDEGMLSQIQYRIKANPSAFATVNYVANHNTFTLYDTVTYDRKYNEANGENNRDGAEINYSWNCGIEGDTRKRKVTDLRRKQIKNAFSLLLLSQGVPMIYAGDEMCNSQGGNNNPYCLDNETSWTNWSDNAMAKDVRNYVTWLIEFRKSNKILHMDEELRQIDYGSFGLPDISFHGTKAWSADLSYFNRHIAFMLCGKYAGKDAKNIYVAFNMYWKPQQVGVPVLKKGHKWKMINVTDISANREEIVPQRLTTIPARSVMILIEE